MAAVFIIAAIARELNRLEAMVSGCRCGLGVLLNRKRMCCGYMLLFCLNPASLGQRGGFPRLGCLVLKKEMMRALS